jgi:glutamate-1-semialdehyde 2,1-aminomutase
MVLCERLQSVDLIRFTNSGSEATLNVFRAARVYTGRHKIAKFEGSYHGSHEFASISVHSQPKNQDGYQTKGTPEFPGMPPGVLGDVLVLPYNDIETTERILQVHGRELACVVMEVIASKFGYVSGKPDFLSSVREITEKLGILLILDEVQSFRVATGGAQEKFQILPEHYGSW